MNIIRNTFGQAAGPDPEKDRDSSPVPERMAEIIWLARILANYGGYLAGMMLNRGIWRGFATIAQYFGVATVSVIEARIRRGIMRANALHRVLLQRAKRGRDLKILQKREAKRPECHAPPPPPRRAAYRQSAIVMPRGPNGPRAEPETTFTRWSSGPLPEGWEGWEHVPQRSPDEVPPLGQQPEPEPIRRGPPLPLTLDNLPSMAQLEAEARRRPIGRTITDICLDLGIAPDLCSAPVWNAVMWAIEDFRGSLGKLIWEMKRRKQQFLHDDWRHPDLPLPELELEGIKQVLGFRIGDRPIDPFGDPFDLAAAPWMAASSCPPAAAATGPP